MRLVSQAIDRTLTSAPNTPVNFGLLFNKFLQYRDNQGKLEPVVKQDRKPLIDDYLKSKKQAADILKQRQLQQAAYCQAMEKAGWRSFIVHARLSSPFVSGLGMAHPTETGLVLDHTSGMPYIPASSQKGVLRVAHLINTLCDDRGNWLPLDVLKERGIVNGNMEWLEDAVSKTLFGTGGDKDALAGQVIALDAYPLTPPELGEEILNPHFGDYYKGNRGPTEDQNPIPIKFLVVKKDAEFVFRLLLRDSFAKARTKEQTALINLLEKSLGRAITEEGMGAKTALGFGRFEVIAHSEPEELLNWKHVAEEKVRLAAEAAEKAAQLAAEKAAREAAAEQERQTLAAMSSADRIVYLIQKPDSSEAILDAQVNQLAQLQEEEQQQVAERIRTHWEAENTWTKKQCSGAQWERVKKISAILEAPQKEPELSPEEQAAIDKVKDINSWSGDLLTRLNAAELPLVALKALQERMKNEWGCSERRAKKDKKQTWRQIQKLIQQAQHADG